MTHGNVLTTPLESNIAIGGFVLSVTLNASAESGVWIANRSRELAQRLGRRLAQQGNTDGNPVENNWRSSHFVLSGDAEQHANITCPEQLPQNPPVPQHDMAPTRTTPEA